MNAIHLTVHPPAGEALIAQLTPPQHTVSWCLPHANSGLPEVGFLRLSRQPDYEVSPASATASEVIGSTSRGLLQVP